MKNRSPSSGRAGRILRSWLGLALPVVVLACSDGEPLDPSPTPSSPGATPGGEPIAPSPGDPEPTTYGSPGADPASAPVENDGPGATETNFLTPPCARDSDCGDGRRCVGGARTAATDGGAEASDGGALVPDGAAIVPDGGAAVTDGGAAADGGAVADGGADESGAGLGHCESIDGG
jgi:hypothetical protein